MLHFVLLSQVLVSAAFPTEEDKVPCDLRKVDISGGHYSLNEDEGTVEYSCPNGKFPYPGPTRKCLYNNLWENQNTKAVCKDVQCPSPVVFENGDYHPRGTSYVVGDVLQFECYGGFDLKGSEKRTCQENGKWSGKTTICDDHSGFCPNPGVPLGTRKDRTSYGIGDKVKYTCSSRLSMFGSKERECTEDKYWTGSEPSCRAWYTYDTAEEVSNMFSSTLTANVEVADPDKNPDAYEQRSIKVKKGDPMNIFIILDASKSVGNENFKTAKNSTITLIDKISTFEITPRYAIISYASKAIPIVSLSDKESLEAEDVIEKLKKFSYEAHADKGTNTRGALHAVYLMLISQEVKEKENFLKIRNVIVLMTDGKHNMGGDPGVEMEKIKSFLDIGEKDNELKRDEFLDVYVFGLGNGVDDNELNDLASKKDKEVHTFHLKNIDTMKNAFDTMIDETDALDMCGLNKEIPEKDIKGVEFTEIKLKEKIIEKFPWIVKIIILRGKSQETCKGTVLSKNFILTAAHCFELDDKPEEITIEAGGKSGLKVKDFYRHPLYKPEGKQDKHIRRSFDYDFALLELEEKLKFSAKTRPICIPCTKSSSWALRKKGEDIKCKEHEDILFKEELVKALFVAEEPNKNMEQKDVTIKMGAARDNCLQDARKLKEFENVTDIRDMVTDQFLCAGGTKPLVEPVTCKGDSGGPLIIEYKKRYIQVGVISWGTVNHCDKRGNRITTTTLPNHARDFHINVFPMLSWIKSVVKEDLVYLKDV
uniref:Complement factor B n=1 Tax=Leptobrachium leishanense TaxID=445787 RepID=A0A8C5MM39_9ANUR